MYVYLCRVRITMVCIPMELFEHNLFTIASFRILFYLFLHTFRCLGGSLF